MILLNEYDVQDGEVRAIRNHMPVAAKGARVLNALVEWTNENSDGWGYWPLPGRASAKLQQALYVRFFGAYATRPDIDLSEAELRRLLAPIKSFLTRRRVSIEERVRILGELA